MADASGRFAESSDPGAAHREVTVETMLAGALR
jgi:hypothetical protein